MSAHREWPEAPNRFNAVTSTLPVLCGVLAAFVSGYFAAVIVSESSIFMEPYVLAPLINPEWCAVPVPVTKRIAISVACVIALALMLGSIIQSIAALMLKFDSAHYEGPPDPPPEVQASWKAKCETASSYALVLFHLSLPMLVLSLILVLNSWVLTLLLYIAAVWFLYTAFSALGELRGN